MRNILVFPDGTEQDFLYPINREILVGETLTAELIGGSALLFTIEEIRPEEKAIRYILAL